MEGNLLEERAKLAGINRDIALTEQAITNARDLPVGSLYIPELEQKLLDLGPTKLPPPPT